MNNQMIRKEKKASRKLLTITLAWTLS